MINTHDRNSRIEATHFRSTIVKKKPASHRVFPIENGQKRLAFDKDMPYHQLGLSIDSTKSTPGVFARPQQVIPVASSSVFKRLHADLPRFIDCVNSNEFVNTNVSRNQFPS